MSVTKLSDHKKSKKSQLEKKLYDQIVDAGFPLPVCAFTGDGKQYRFYPGRLWRMDFAWPDLKIGIECQGGLWAGKGHGGGTAYRNDRIKSAYAQFGGWIYLEASTDMIRDGMAIDLLKVAFTVRKYGYERID